jgi:hypothetical protein
LSLARSAFTVFKFSVDVYWPNGDTALWRQPARICIAPNVGEICGEQSVSRLFRAAHLPGRRRTDLASRLLSTSRRNSKSELMLNIFLSGEFNFDQFGRDERLCRCRLQLASAFPKFDANSNGVQSDL